MIGHWSFLLLGWDVMSRGEIVIGHSTPKVDAVDSEMKVLFDENPELGRACSFQLRVQSVAWHAVRNYAFQFSYCLFFRFHLL